MALFDRLLGRDDAGNEVANPIPMHQFQACAAEWARGKGTVVVDRAGAINGQVPIDTTPLANAPHKLVIIATADEPNSTKLSGSR